tara:strand:+ start:2609 stop:3670 length:1062 start_codon:yes stop_codon:yes gene_type:complete
MLITEKRLRHLIKRALLEDSDRYTPPVSEVKVMLESIIPEAKERFKRDNKKFIRSLSRGLGPLNIFKKRAVIKALKNFDVDIVIEDSIERAGRNVLGFYTLSRDQQFYDNLKRLADSFEEDAGESREEVERELRDLENFISNMDEDTPYGKITLSASAIAKYYANEWDPDDDQNLSFKNAVLTNVFYEEISHFLDFFANTIINDVTGSEPFSIEGEGSEWIIKVDRERLGSATEGFLTIESLLEKNLLERDFNQSGDNTSLIMRKLPVSEEEAGKIQRSIINYISEPTELNMAFSELKRDFISDLSGFFDDDPYWSGLTDRTKLIGLYVILDPSKRSSLKRFLKRFREVRAAR